MCRVARWAKKYPEDVRIVGVDDSYYSGSDLVLIEHRGKVGYHGTTVIFIAQCSGDPPVRFFLYPSHRDSLMAALMAIKQAALPPGPTAGDAPCGSPQARVWALGPAPSSSATRVWDTDTVCPSQCNSTPMWRWTWCPGGSCRSCW
jgi:hypothetical protein